MFEKEIDYLRKKNIQLENGLNDSQIDIIEKKFNIHFPISYRNFLKEIYPIGEGFYKWFDFSEENVNKINKMLLFPYQSIIDNVSEIVWNKKWGVEPKTIEEKKIILKQLFKTAPKVIPVYAHRYIVVDATDNPPVLSIYYTDIIIYGIDLKDYLLNEFNNPERNLRRPDQYIEFWSDIEENDHLQI